jgi:hypothetical protein
MNNESSAFDYFLNNPNSKKKFWETDMGKIFAHGIHEHNSALGKVGTKIALYKAGKYTLKDIPFLVNDLQNDLKKAQDSMDYIYENVRKLQGF